MSYVRGLVCANIFLAINKCGIKHSSWIFGVGINIGPLTLRSLYVTGYIYSCLPQPVSPTATQTTFNGRSLYGVQEIVTRSQYNAYCFHFLLKDVAAMLKWLWSNSDDKDSTSCICFPFLFSSLLSSLFFCFLIPGSGVDVAFQVYLGNENHENQFG